ncbi:N-acetyl-gamma-glutamyl-phosphate reductase [Acanthopleuribacter pedis]|uniref:N-acetyl-gamma-glutamyl-phosphate reductase n=1 Tax=Acanthopleuribacter pedis TaxID=442870 RepID=A0A8J7U307_9BACT|nr:N-acetyl-gamma-glutamyl-phosphate reductase [Acanthopleuribacter pedis]MBO1317833.1 N-acetyl-gamma-glutamyl-phosphate reductase [Acanthopleuribacter pedis]
MNHPKNVRAALFGATGYSGLELMQLIKNHPFIEITHATSRKAAGSCLSEVFPTLERRRLCAPDAVDLASIDLAFLCLPHGGDPGCSMEEAARLRAAGVAVVDLSGDYRLKDLNAYMRWYGCAHRYPELVDSAVYGLSEWNRAAVAEAALVANPGCYPTCTALSLWPLFGDDLMRSGSLVINAMSGVSGAGRGAKVANLYVEVNESAKAYNPGQKHRHLPEIRQTLTAMAGHSLDQEVVFTPHLIPVNRGILTTTYVPLKQGVTFQQCHARYRDHYDAAPFVHVLNDGEQVCLRHAVGSNHVVISLHQADDHGLIVCAAMDNLIKGAAGQALQNANIMLGFAETEGLL